MEQEIILIRKNTRERIRIGLAKVHKHDLVDVRIYVPKGDGLTHTEKGVAVPIRLLPDLIAGLQDAAAVAASAGLLK